MNSKSTAIFNQERKIFMKKIIALLLALVLSFTLIACGNGGEDDTSKTTESTVAPSVETTSEETTAKETTAVETTEAETTEADDGKLKNGDSGEGPATLESAFVKVDIPKGLNYEISSYNTYETNPLYGNIKIVITNERGMVVAKVNASSQNMVTDQKGAVEKVISLFNLGSYKEGKSSVEDGVKYGENTYSLVKISTENFKKDCFVTYVAGRNTTDEKGLMLYLEVDLKQIASDDPMIKEILNSITIVKE